MKTTLSIIFCGIIVLLSGCAAGISRTGYKPPENKIATTPPRPIAIQCNAKYDTNDVVVLGAIHAYDTGFSTACDEASILDIFCKEGNSLGADLIDLTEEKQPDFWSTCYRAKAQFIQFKDREKAKGLVSDAKFAPELVIERSVESKKRSRDLIMATVFGGALGAIIVTSVESSHHH